MARFQAGWIRSCQFDLILILGCLILAISLGSASYYYPKMYPVILFLNIWLLGYHHVIATYTRFLETSVRQNHRWLITGLPFIVVICVFSIGMLVGIWALATIYLYWQCFHYARQGHGIIQAYRRKINTDSFALPLPIYNLLIYGIPLWGILYRSAQQPETFLSMPVKVIPYIIASNMADIMRVIILCTFIIYIGYVVYQVFYNNKKISVGYHAFILSYILIFYLGYIFIDDINRGWLFLNIWHNAQYIIFVWLFNNNASKKSIETAHSKKSFLSYFYGDYLYRKLCRQPVIIYFAITFGSTLVFYYLVRNFMHFTINFTGIEEVLVFMIIYQTINFHHYIVDAYIWKMRKKSIQNTLNIKQTVSQ